MNQKVTFSKAEPDDDISRLTRWLDRKPEAADTLRLVEQKLARNDVVVEYSAEEVTKIGTEKIAASILEECELWAETKQKITPFVIQWLAEGRDVKTRPFKFVPDSLTNVGQTGLPPADGSVESFLASMQAAGIRKDQIQINMLESVVGLFLQLVDHQQQRIAWLEGQEMEVRKLKEEMLELTSGDQQDETRFNRLMQFLEKGLQAKAMAAASIPDPRKTPV